MRRSLVSVVVPTYNHAAFIERSVSSVLAQTHLNYEVIIIDDGSRDDTSDRVSRRWPNESRITYIRQENSGLGAARNRGLSLAEGEYIQFLDADDSIAARKFELQIQMFEVNENIDVVYSDYAHLGGANSHVGEVALPLAPGESPLSWLIRENFMPVHSPLVKRKVFDKEGGFDESRVAQEDWDFWLRLACRNCKFIYLPGVFSYYHHDGNTMTNNPELMYQRGLHLLNKFLTDPMFVDLGKDVVQEFSFHQHYALATRSYNQQRWLRTISHLLRAITARPRLADGNLQLLLLKALVHQLLNLQTLSRS